MHGKYELLIGFAYIAYIVDNAPFEPATIKPGRSGLLLCHVIC